MENKQKSKKGKIGAKRRTEYARAGGAFGIQLGKPVRLPNLKRNILNTSCQALQQKPYKFQSLQKVTDTRISKEQNFPRFTSLDTVENNSQRREMFPKINNKLMKQMSAQRLERISSQQNLSSQASELVGPYRLGGIIGKGSYASVRLVKSWKGGTFAMKIYQKKKMQDSLQIKNIQHEIEVLEKIQHPNIIKYYETIHTPETINIVTELVENNSLVEYVRMQKDKKIAQPEAQVIMKDILKALAYMHSKNIVHRDLKLENILISKQMRIKLIDFGFSNFDHQIHYDFCGTPHYLSPEIISKGGYTGQAADIWAIGVVLYKILSGSFPFKAVNDKILYRKICRGQYSFDFECSPTAKQLIREALSMDPSKRPSAAWMLNSAWLTQLTPE